MSLDGFSMRPLVLELQAALTGGRIDKITQPNRNSIVLSVRQPGENHFLHISTHSQNPAAHLISKPPENPSEPPVFCMVLRKQIEGGRIADIRQHGLDRLILLDIDTLAAGGKILTKTLAVELMGKYSNMILLQEGIILDALRKIGENSSRVRTVLPGQTYELPPGQEKWDLFEKSPGDIVEGIKSRPEMKLSKAILDVCMGFGPVSAKELAYMAGLPANIPVGELDEADFHSLEGALEDLRNACREKGHATILCQPDGKILAMAAFPLHYLSGAEVLEFPAVSPLLERAGKLLGSYVPPDRERFKKLVKNELSRARGKLEKIREELEEAEHAEASKIRADNLMTYQYDLQDHADAEVTVPDIYSEQGTPISIPLDQRLTIIQNMQAYYKKYDKLKRAQELLKEQIAKNREEISYLESIEASLMASSSLAEIGEIHNELVAGGYLKEKVKKKNNDKPSRPFRFQSPDGTEILVGKNNFQNDKLTFKTAAPGDLWLHAKDIPGSHVILRCRGEEPAEETLFFAAQIAAYFSKAQGSSKVPVDYTQCRHVKKPSGAKPGFVIFTGQKTLYVTPEENFGERL